MYQGTIYKNFQIVFAFYRYTNVITCESFRSQASLVQNLKEYERHNTFFFVVRIGNSPIREGPGYSIFAVF